jgi:prepilin-type N-terminal cleavage/methylation domain-containing protein
LQFYGRKRFSDLGTAFASASFEEDWCQDMGRQNDTQGFTLIEVVIIIVVVSVLAAIAIPHYVDMRERAMIASARAILAEGRTAVLLDFSEHLLRDGTYTVPFSGTVGKKFNNADRAALESMLQSQPRYPPYGTYDYPDDGGFRWWLVSAGTSSPGDPEWPGIGAMVGDLKLQ